MGLFIFNLLMEYTIDDALTDASSWDIGSDVAVIVRAYHLINGEVRELTFKTELEFESALDDLDQQGYSVTCYNNSNMFHRECSLSFNDLMIRLIDEKCI